MTHLVFLTHGSVLDLWRRKMVDKRIIEFNHKILDILDEYADIITFPSIRVFEKIGGGFNEMKFTVSFKCIEDLKTAEQKLEHEYFKLNKELDKE